ncbi:hypothetical protein [Notoacmeibacter ruber]|uniref:Uncharacterized protein n=1 Tax=Notoacmeibacter ruber TaxID=2670375 RepID=A0A3L7J8Z1_9HYPH|nr:hypothetical protein [Notoacmeibacter ruber]RLQ86835.1 hypothetical protein D8780_00075 [Notoacmeibacter ruber]
MTNKSAKPAATSANQPNGLASIIVLGRDDKAKPHASWFGASEEEIARKAAGLMGMATLTVSGEELEGLSRRLPQGKVFASGKAFVPFVKADLFEQLAGHLPEAERELLKPHEPPEPFDGETVLIESWDKLSIGGLVLAWEGKDAGWWEAVITTIHPNDLVTLQWCDYPDEPRAVRKRSHIALLHPKHDQPITGKAA